MRLLSFALLLLLAPVCPAADPVSVTLDTVVSTATRSQQTVANLPIAVTVVTAEELDEDTASSTPDLLERALGVYIQKSNPGGGSPILRGLTGKQVLLLVDGLRLNNSFYRAGPHQYLNTVDPASLERIEIIRGPASVLYGSDALGGVVNLITRAPRARCGLDLVFAKTLDTAYKGGATSAHLEGDRFRVGGSYKKLNSLRAGGKLEQQAATGYDEYAIDAAYRLPLPVGALTLSQQYLAANDVPKTSEVTLGSAAIYNYEPQRRSLIQLDYAAGRLGPVERLRANLSLSRQEEGEYVVRRASPSKSTDERSVVSTPALLLQAGNTLVAGPGSHGLSYGVEASRDRLDTRKTCVPGAASCSAAEGRPTVPDGASYQSLGLFLQDEWSGRWGSLIAGGRYSAYQARGRAAEQALALDVSQATGSLQGLLRLSPRWGLIAGLAQGYRAPNLEDFFGRVDFGEEIPNLELRPETSVEQQLGLRYRDPRTEAELFVYQADYRNLIERSPSFTVVEDGETRTVRQRRNLAEARYQGLEFGLRHTLNRQWSLAGNGSYTQGEDQLGLPLRRVPPFNGAVSARYQASPALFAELELRLADGQDRLSAGDRDDLRICPDAANKASCDGTPGYSLWRLETGYQRRPGEHFNLVLENLGDKLYKTHGSGVYASGFGLQFAYRNTFTLF
ncbi:MAG: TonB-dependent receptor [Stagnimonas sp.]|nr:TonB-dependent receptor [Stagnimonas sp.]